MILVKCLTLKCTNFGIFNFISPKRHLFYYSSRSLTIRCSLMRNYFLIILTLFPTSRSFYRPPHRYHSSLVVHLHRVYSFKSIPPLSDHTSIIFSSSRIHFNFTIGLSSTVIRSHRHSIIYFQTKPSSRLFYRCLLLIKYFHTFISSSV